MALCGGKKNKLNNKKPRTKKQKPDVVHIFRSFSFFFLLLYKNMWEVETKESTFSLSRQTVQISKD